MTPHLSALGFTLIHFCWQAALIGGLYKLAELTLPRLRHPERYLMGLVALVAMLVVAVGTFVYEDLRLSREPAVVAMASVMSSVPASDTKALESLLPWLDAAWLAGVAVLALRMIGGLWFIHRLQATAMAVPDAVLRRFQTLMQRAGLKDVAIRLHPKIDGPFVIGALKSIVYLPVSALTALTPDQLDAVLAHELEHVRRADYLWNLVQSAIETLFFFHPVVWWLGAQLREQRELCCDDAAVRLCRDPLTYATALLHLEERRRTAPGLVMALNGEGSGRKLVSRIARLLGERTGPARKGRSPAAYALPIVALILALFVAPGAQVVARTNPKPLVPARWTLETTDIAPDEQAAQEMDATTAASVEGQSHVPAAGQPATAASVAQASQDQQDAVQRAAAMARGASNWAGDWVAQTFAWTHNNGEWQAQAAQWKTQQDDWVKQGAEWEKAQIEWSKNQEDWAKQGAEWEKAQIEWAKTQDEWPSKAEQMAMREEALAAQREAYEEMRADMAEHAEEMRRDREDARQEALRDAEDARQEALRDAEDARRDAAEARRQMRPLPPVAPLAPVAPMAPIAPMAPMTSRLTTPTPPAAPAPVAAPRPVPAPVAPAAPVAPRAVAYKIDTAVNTVIDLPAFKVKIDKPVNVKIDKAVKVKIDKPVKVKIDKTVAVHVDVDTRSMASAVANVSVE